MCVVVVVIIVVCVGAELLMKFVRKTADVSSSRAFHAPRHQEVASVTVEVGRRELRETGDRVGTRSANQVLYIIISIVIMIITYNINGELKPVQ